MTMKYNDIKNLAYPREFIYNIVADVEKYPQFIPWLSKVKVLSKEENKTNYEISVDFKVITETFSTMDIFYPHDKIEISLIEGPFKHLYNTWTFKSVSDNMTQVTFSIEFEFKSKVLGILFSNLFVQAQKKILEAFNERAKELYKRI